MGYHLIAVNIQFPPVLLEVCGLTLHTLSFFWNHTPKYRTTDIFEGDKLTRPYPQRKVTNNLLCNRSLSIKAFKCLTGQTFRLRSMIEVFWDPAGIDDCGGCSTHIWWWNGHWSWKSELFSMRFNEPRSIPPAVNSQVTAASKSHYTCLS